jgi:uncharacterized protein (DUF362 family)
MSAIGFARIQNNSVEPMRKAIIETLNLINYAPKRDIRNIVIKPNLCYYWDYSTGQTTNPIFVEALIKVLRMNISKDANISIVESDASAMKCKYAFTMLGYDSLAKEHNVKLINLSEDHADTVNTTVGNKTYRLSVPRTIADCDLRINVPKVKYTPRQTKITCALKNVFGCNPYPKKFRLHPDLGNIVVAVNKAMKFDLCIVDGSIVSGIQPRWLGLVMTSRDPVAIDSAAAKIMGLNANMRYLKQASKEGLGSISFVARGKPLKYFKENYPKQDAKTRMVSMAYNLVVTMKLAKRLGLE